MNTNIKIIILFVAGIIFGISAYAYHMTSLVGQLNQRVNGDEQNISILQQQASTTFAYLNLAVAEGVFPSGQFLYQQAQKMMATSSHP